jgi:hypothetical protein
MFITAELLRAGCTAVGAVLQTATSATPGATALQLQPWRCCSCQNEFKHGALTGLALAILKQAQCSLHMRDVSSQHLQCMLCVCSALAPQLQCTCCHCLVVMVALQAAIMKPVSNAVYTVITADEALELVLAIVQTMTRASSRFNQSVSWCLKLGIGAGGFSWGATNKWCQRFASTQDVHHIAMTHYSAAVWCVAPQHQLYVEHCR